MKRESLPHIRDMLRSIRGLKHNLERFTEAAGNFAESEREHKDLYPAALRVSSMLGPTAAIFNQLEKKLEIWLAHAEDRDSNGSG